MKAMPLYDETVWKITLQTQKAARLAETQRRGQDDAHAAELAEARNEISQLREALGLRTQDFQDGVAVNAQLQNELDGYRRELAAARTRLAELGHNE